MNTPFPEVLTYNKTFTFTVSMKCNGEKWFVVYKKSTLQINIVFFIFKNN